MSLGFLAAIKMKLMQASDRVSEGRVTIKRQRPLAFGDCSLASVCKAIDKADSPMSANVVWREGQGFGRGRFGRREPSSLFVSDEP